MKQTTFKSRSIFLKILKYVGITFLIIIVALFIIVQFRQNRKFSAEFPAIQASTDTTIIARGRQLVLGAAHCASCHGAGPETRSTALSGGQKFEIPIGDLYAPNLTPSETGILYKSDGAIARALRYGVKSDGTALFDFMPFHNTSDADLVAIISYLRAQPPVNNKVPKNSMNLLGKVVKAFLLKPAGPTEIIPAFVQQDTTAAYGGYIANSIANCKGCHTNRDLMTGAFIGTRYAGGFTMETKTDTGAVFITSPDLRNLASGRIYGWSQEQFIGRFRKGRIIEHSHMPWEPFSKMSDNELKAIYKYLKTLK